MATQRFLEFSPQSLGFHDPIWRDAHIFQMGWFKLNHQAVMGCWQYNSLVFTGLIAWYEVLWGCWHPYGSQNTQTLGQIWVLNQKYGKTPQIIHFNKVFHYKPSILGTPIFGNIHILMYCAPVALDNDLFYSMFLSQLEHMKWSWGHVCDYVYIFVYVCM